MAERVLVTGGSGVVGSAAIRSLVATGCNVVSMQRGPLPSELTDLGVTEARGDIANAAAVAQAMQGIDAVVHAAARVEIIGPWSEFEAVNVTATRTVLDAAEGAGVQRFVFISSPSVAHVGEPIVGGAAEPADPPGARGHYSRSKAMAELEALSRDREGFAVTSLRPHLVWGVGDTQLTARIVARARAGRLVTIGSGAALIDTTYIDNAGDAIACAVERTTVEGVHGQPLVVSNGEPRTVVEMLTRIAEAAGAPGPRRSVPFAVARAGGRVVEEYWERSGRSGEPPVTSFLAEQLATAHWFDQRQTRRLLDWTPRVRLDEGFERLAASYAPLG